MAEKTEGRKPIEWTGPLLEPEVTFFAEAEYPLTLAAQATGDPGEVAIHVRGMEVDDEETGASLYLTVSEALLLAERIATAAFIAEKVNGAPDAR